MKPKYLYLIALWIPFPESEYGGLLNAIAESDEDCIKILELEYESEGSWKGGYAKELKKAVKEAKKFELSDAHEHEEQRIVMEFTT